MSDSKLEKAANTIVDLIISDICDRKSIGYAWEYVDSYTEIAIRESWKAIILEVLNEQRNSPSVA